MIGIDPVLSEVINLSLASLCMFVVVIFTRYLIAEYKAGRLVVLQWRPFGGMLRHQMAIAIIVSSFGEAAIRIWVWVARVGLRIGEPTRWMAAPPWVWVPAIAAAIQAAGLLCFIRVVTPDEWSRGTWIVCIAIVVLMVLASGALRLPGL